MRRRRVLGALAATAVIGALLFLPQQSTAYELRWDVRTLRDGIPPIYDPGLTTPDNIDLAPEEMVLAVEINGDARALSDRATGELRDRE